MVVHAHAHRGCVEGKTMNAVPCYNVSMPLLARTFPDRLPFRMMEVPRTELPGGAGEPQWHRMTGSCGLAQLAGVLRTALDLLNAHGPPFLVGGTFAYTRYTGHPSRHEGSRRLRTSGRRGPNASRSSRTPATDTELPYPHWLGKVLQGDDLMDVVFASGNGVAQVDDDWFTYAAESRGPRHAASTLSSGRDDLVESVRAGTRAIRRRRRPPPLARGRGRT